MSVLSMTPRVISFVLILISLGLTACGGGGGAGGGSGPAGVSVLIDSTSPTKDSSGVTMDSPIEVRLTSSALANATKIDAQFTLTGPSGPVTGTVSIGSASGTFSPSARLERFSQYDARIILTIHKSDGSVATDDYSWSFHTAWTQIAMSDVPDTQGASGLAFDTDGNIYVAGAAQGNFDSNQNVNTTTPIYFDRVLVKYDPNGHKLWSRQFGTSGDDFTGGVAVDGAGNAFVAGIIGDGGAGTGVSLTKFDAGGNVLWTQSASPPGYTVSNVFVTGVAVDAVGDVVVVGSANTSYPQIFLVKFSSSGVQLWFHYDDREFAYSRAVRIDSGNSIYVIGQLTGIWANQSTLTDPRNFMLLAKYDPSGVKQWDQLLGATPQNSSTDGVDVAINSHGDIYVAGGTNGVLTGSAQDGAIFIAKYSPSGTMQYVKQNGGSAYPGRMAVDENDDVYVIGLTDVLLDPSGSSQPGSPFMAKYDSAGILKWIHQRPIFYQNYSFGADRHGHLFEAGHGFSLVDGNNDVMRDAVVTFRFNLDGMKN